MRALPSLPVSVVDLARARRGRGWYVRLRALVWLAPALGFLGLFVYLPAGLALGLALFHYHLGPGPLRWAGVSNVTAALTDPVFWQALRVTGLYAVLLVPATLGLSLAIALALWRQTRIHAWMRTLVLLPYVTPVVGTAIGWLWIFNPQYGVANAILRGLGLAPIGWIDSVRWAVPSVVLYSLWHGVGFDVVVLLSALGGLPAPVLEAARVDGAGRWMLFRAVTLPLISPSLYFVGVTTTIGALQSFSPMYVLSGGKGGPELATTTLVLWIYQTAFQYFHLSYAAAITLLLVAMILGLTLVQQWAARRWVFYQ